VTSPALAEALDLIAPDLERTVRAFVRAGHLPGASVGIVVDDEFAWSYAVGTTEQDAGSPIDRRTLFRIASITKTFTATAIVQLRDRGRLRLDDPLVHHIPEAAAIRSPFGPIDEITLRRLLTHTAGMPIDVPAPLDVPVYPFEGYEIGSILASIGHIRPFAAPGTIHQYSDVGFQLLGEVVARVSGLPYQSYVTREVSGPLGMGSTVFDLDRDLDAALRVRVAHGYQAYDHDDRLRPARTLDSRDLGALGGLWSCVDDLSRWISAQFGPYRPDPGGSAILTAGSLVEMHRQVVLADDDWTESQGLGWEGTRSGDLTLVGHGGGLPGYITDISMQLGERLGAIVLLNGNSRAHDLSVDLLRLMRPVVATWRERHHRHAAPDPPEVPDRFADLVGLYRDPDRGKTYRVTLERGHLAIAAEARSPDRLAPTDASDRFGIIAADGSSRGFVTFVRHDGGRVAWLNFDGYPYAEETVAPRYSV
jgi:CubicO group peptidase (beta-lactamase class C family)